MRWDANNNSKSNRNRRFQLMCLPMNHVLLSARFVVSFPLSHARVVCAWEKMLSASTEWLLTDNIQRRYLMLLLITHSSWENYSDEINRRWEGRVSSPTSGDGKRWKIALVKTAIDGDYNLWIRCLSRARVIGEWIRSDKNEFENISWTRRISQQSAADGCSWSM